MSELPRKPTLARHRVLLLPGIGNSGLGHWQSRWEAQQPTYIRVQQHDWDNPICVEWMEALEKAVQHNGSDIFIAAHSLGCLLAVHWLARTSCKIRGALLVSVPDPNSHIFPTAALGFVPLPQQRLPAQNIVVASSNDPDANVEFARQCVYRWAVFSSISATPVISIRTAIWVTGTQVWICCISS